MLKGRFSWVTVALVLAILVLTIRSVQAKRDAELAASQVALRQEAEKPMLTMVTSSDLIMARKYIESFAVSNGLPVRVRVSGPEITVTSAPETEADALAADGVNREVKKEDKIATLSHFHDPATGKGLLNFLTMVAGMKYRMNYKSICLGTDCNAGIEMVLTCEGVGNKNERTAPNHSAQTSPPGQPNLQQGGTVQAATNHPK